MIHYLFILFDDFEGIKDVNKACVFCILFLNYLEGLFQDSMMVKKMWCWLDKKIKREREIRTLSEQATHNNLKDETPSLLSKQP